MEIALLDDTRPTLAENLALDEALLLEAEEGVGGEVLRFWEWPTPAVVLGAGGSLAADVDQAACQRDQVVIQRRSSGGGTVLLGTGCLLFSLVLRYGRDPALRDVNASYRYILGRVIRALKPVVHLELSGISDLTSAGFKCSGNAQQRKRDHVLHHGTLLYRFDTSLISAYLRIPAKQPAYRQGRSHEGFVANLNVESTKLKQKLAEEWQVGESVRSYSQERILELVQQKYLRSDWVARR